ncbi:oligosaccharide repeat unit polymerase [Paenisporosarcina quisquiliarum]|uniref:Oligosaccharide repeat unit polymerase n=1 Tax=Paenisporosarcina quisquiliarum TaxID=365346 RepID=A0A9X3REA5_9BACL|nr:O-antigen polymerase [Paenisporosarcina quisquiliarum]MCZ8537257.1 oligosaccharide repeat unit polymerase [Paenisporosarcina quisquiliarum]
MNFKNKYLDISLITFTVIISYLFLQFGNNIWGGVIALAILVLLALYLSKLDIVHPLTWYSTTYFLYCVAYPILVAMGEISYDLDLKKTLYLEWIGLLTFIIVIGTPKKREYSAKGLEKLQNLNFVIYPIYVLSLFLTMVYIAYIYTNNLNNKYLIALDQSGIGMLTPFFSIYILSFNLIVAYRLVIKEHYPKTFLLFNVIYTFMALMVIGERDLMLKVILGVIFLSHILYKPISRKIIILSGIGMIFLINLLGDLKSAAFDKGPRIEIEQSLLSKVLNGEFISASRNLSVLINGSDSWTYYLGKTFFWDIQVAFFNGSNSILEWFNNTYYPNLSARGGGNGFTIVGEGYINFGVFGVILIFIFLGLFLKFLYKKAINNVIWLIIYIASIPIFIYLNRADLATLFAQIGKHLFLPIFIIYLIKQIVEKNSGRVNNS